MTIELDLIHTILVSMVVLFAGRALVAKIGVLARFKKAMVNSGIYVDERF